MKKIIIFNLKVIFIIMICTISFSAEQNEPIECIKPNEVREIMPNEVIELYEPDFDAQEESEPEEEWDANEKYLLAKIAMAEAEGCSTQTKAYVIMTILNRVKNNKFPNTVEEVIFEKHGNTYQFTPVGDGRWYKVEPNDDCWKALDIALSSDTSQGALFFESCTNEDNWHSRNLQFLYKSNTMRFYK